MEDGLESAPSVYILSAGIRHFIALLNFFLMVSRVSCTLEQYQLGYVVEYCFKVYHFCLYHICLALGSSGVFACLKHLMVE